MYNKHKRSVVVLSCVTRLITVAIQFIGNSLIPDHNAGVFTYPKLNQTLNFADKAVAGLFGGFVRWDAQYFMHIAKYGYTYENTLAFFPLFPLLARSFTRIILRAVTFLSEDSILLVVFLVLNFYFFRQAVLALYDLTAIILNRKLAYISSILFCLNPATIFFVAPYTESMFCYLTFKSFLILTRLHNFNGQQANKLTRFKMLIGSILLVALSTSARSNGILNVCFIAYFTIQSFFKRLPFIKTKFQILLYTFVHFIMLALIILICLLPFFLVQINAYNQFCRDFSLDVPSYLVTFAHDNELIMSGSFSQHKQSWCLKTVPLAYSYVQDHYWKVGFLKYFQIKQLPNFLLASPLVFIILSNAYRFFKQHREYCLNLGVFNIKIVRYEVGQSSPYFNKEMFIFVVHATFLTLFCFFCIHVQVTTRMLCSASPVLYWFCAYKFENMRESRVSIGALTLLFKKGNKHQKFVLYYFISYVIIGTIMFSNFLPWT